MKMNHYFFLLLFGALCSCSAGGGDTPPPPIIDPVDLMWGEVSGTPDAVRAVMVDKNATAATAALFYNLKSYASAGVMLGQQDATIKRYAKPQDVFNPESDIKRTTGKTPIVIGCDFMFSTDKHNTGAPGWWADQEKLLRHTIQESRKAGCVATISWHIREPYFGDHFYVSDMDKVDPTLKQRAFRSILQGGENHEAYKVKLDKIADILLTTKDEKGEVIPVIFRPFHEFDGSWFWWGIPHYASAADYIANWQFTVKYLRDTKGVHNVLYAFSPGDSFTHEGSFLECYPGDEYVDMIGFDTYENYSKSGAAGVTKVAAKLKIISDIARQRKKIAALTEFGYTSENPQVQRLFTDHFLKTFTKQKVEIAYAMFWSNGLSAYFTPVDGKHDVSDFRSFVGNNYTFELEDVRPLFDFPSKK